MDIKNFHRSMADSGMVCFDRDSGRPPPIVIDNGSCYLKAGAACNSDPTCIQENAFGVSESGLHFE